jgi:hypothetical protein
MRSPCCVRTCISVIVARQRLCKHVLAAMNIHATTAAVLDVSFSTLSVSY